MPLPSPQEYNNDETFNEFMDRCMSDNTMRKEYPDSKQRYAVCLNISAEYSFAKTHTQKNQKQVVVDDLKPRYTTTDKQGS